MESDRVVQLTESQLKQLMEEAVTDALVKLGVDTQAPLEMQKDFQHLREWREATHTLQKRGLTVIMTTLITGGLAALYLGIKMMLSSP